MVSLDEPGDDAVEGEAARRDGVELAEALL